MAIAYVRHPPSGRRAPALRLATDIAIGILAGRYLPASPLSVWAGAGGLVVLLILLRRGTPPRALFTLSAPAMLLAALLGMARYAAVMHSLPVLPDSVLHTPVAVAGLVCDEPSFADGRYRFPLEVHQVVAGGTVLDVPAKAVVTMRVRAAPGETTLIAYGSLLRLPGILERPSPGRNPGDFDARTYYEANGITLMLRVVHRDSVTVLPGGGGTWWMRSLVLPARRMLLQSIDRTVGGEEGEFLKGLLVGERSGLSRSLRESFARSGTAHVLAVSGSNVAVIAGALFLLLEFLRTGRRMRILLTCLGIGFYMLLTGGQPPVVRAGVMATIVLCAGLVRERPHTLNSLGVAAAGILLYDPRQLFDIGFQLSFTAVLAIVLLYPPLNALIDRIAVRGLPARLLKAPLRLAALSLAATIGTLPLTAIAFGRVSMIGLLSNIVVVPASGLSVILGLATAFSGSVCDWLARTYGALNALILRLTILTAEVSGAPSFATLETAGFRWVDALAFYAAILWVLRFHARRSLFAASVLALLALHAAVWLPSPPVFGSSRGLLRVAFLDVGQGDAAVIELPNGRTILVDAGGWTPVFDAGERVVLPYLKRRGIRAIDLLVVTHPHGDHAGGAPAVVRTMPVRGMLDPGGPELNRLREALRPEKMPGPGYAAGRAGMAIALDPETRVYLLSPDPGCVAPADAADAATNNMSVVLKVCYGSTAFLLTGDAELEAEEVMLSTYGDLLRAAVLKVGHHGGSRSSSERFLDAVHPHHAVISVGRGNTFGHPTAEVLGRLGVRGIETLRTDEEGAVIFESDGRWVQRIEWR